MPLNLVGHTQIVTDEAGQTHVQHLGSEHVVEGSVRVLMVPVGETVVIRHYVPRRQPVMIDFNEQEYANGP